MQKDCGPASSEPSNSARLLERDRHHYTQLIHRRDVQDKPVAMPDRIRKLQVRLSILERDGLLVKTAMDHAKIKTNTVRIAVARLELTCSTPTFASIAVRVRKNADSNAQVNRGDEDFQSPALGGGKDRRWDSILQPIQPPQLRRTSTNPLARPPTRTLIRSLNLVRSTLQPASGFVARGRCFPSHFLIRSPFVRRPRSGPLCFTTARCFAYWRAASQHTDTSVGRSTRMALR